jgi:hypothetical protein
MMKKPLTAHTDPLLRILALYGLPPKVVSMIEALNLDSKCIVKIPDRPTNSFKISTGVLLCPADQVSMPVFCGNDVKMVMISLFLPRQWTEYRKT